MNTSLFVAFRFPLTQPPVSPRSDGNDSARGNVKAADESVVQPSANTGSRLRLIQVPVSGAN